MAGVGVGLLDLAALIAGGWGEEQQHALAWSYLEAAHALGDKWPVDEFFETLDCCRWYIALQWLGWSEEWTAPPDHAHDWLNEALAAGKRLTQSDRAPRYNA
jgi:hypothetical protein